jgi:hypothetical protein
MARRNISKRLRFEVLARDGFRCQYCGLGSNATGLHIDHVIAVANGGSNERDNLITACIDCNLGKGAIALTSMPSASQLIDCPFADGWPNDIEDPVFFANKSWAVTGYGLECLFTFYPIPSERLAENRGRFSDWLLHLAEKGRFAARYDDLAEAFRRAIHHHRIAAPFSIPDSIEAGRNEADETLESGLE